MYTKKKEENYMLSQYKMKNFESEKFELSESSKNDKF